MKTFNNSNLKKKNSRILRYTQRAELSQEEYQRKRLMCSSCKFYNKDNQICEKQRPVRKCAELGLKNKE